jgi:hypothetical protein
VAGQTPGDQTLSRTSKLNNIDLSAIAQAGSGDHWLTNQRGDVTYYEVMMNQDEFEFITQANFDLTTAAGQLACATQPGQPVSDGPKIKPPYPPGTVLRGGINFPAGVGDGWDDTDCTGATHGFGQNVGAMEVKAAWTPLPADQSLDYRYKTAQAEILDPTTKKVRNVTVGLTGLHIIRKRFPRLPWVWATFEQIDNSPDEATGGGFTPPALPANPNQQPSPGFAFFNPKCDSAKDKVYQCKHNVPPTPCGPAGTPCDPYTAPMQITRINPVGATANSVTAYVWGMLPAKSVFNYYRLVDVQWPTVGIATPVPGPGLKTPLTMGTPNPQGAAGGPTQIGRQHHAGILPADFEQLHGLPRLRAHRLAAIAGGGRAAWLAQGDEARGRCGALCGGLFVFVCFGDEAVVVGRSMTGPDASPFHWR